MSLPLPRKRSIADRWSGMFSDRQRENDARRLESQIAEMRALLAHARAEAVRAKGLLRPEWARPAKDLLIQTLQPVKTLDETAELMGKTNHLRDLPSHFVPARALVDEHAQTLRDFHAFRLLLSRATVGDTDQVLASLHAMGM